MACYGSAASRFQVPQVAPKEERRVLWYASDGLRGEMGCLGPAQRQALKVVLDEIADGSGVVDVDGSGREAGIEGLACKGLIAGKGQRVAIDQVE